VGKEAYDRAKRGDGPTLLEFRVPRLGSHSSDDQQERYRSKEEIEDDRRRDPLRVFGAYLEGVGLLTEAKKREIADRVKREITEATDAADLAPLPEPESGARYVFAEPD
jgi:2-oxoisovalerate dehydrogenase E1 component alpha subunit